QTEAEVFQLESRVESAERRKHFLCRDDGRSEQVAIAGTIEVGIGSEQLGGLKDELPVSVECRAGRLSAIDQLRQIDGAGLLPHDEGVDRARALAPLRSHHL